VVSYPSGRRKTLEDLALKKKRPSESLSEDNGGDKVDEAAWAT
jgi:hypothetical protein